MNGSSLLNAQRSPTGIQRRMQSLLKGPNQALPTQEKNPTAGKLFKDIIGKPLPELPPKLPSQISVRNVARFDLEETMTEGSDVAADYSSDGSEDSIVQLRRQFNLAMNRANAPEEHHTSSHSAKHSLASPYQQRQDDDSSSYDSLNHVSVEDHINFVSQSSQRETSLPNARAAPRRSPHHAPHSDDDDEAADSRNYHRLLSSITTNMLENRLGGGGIEPFEIDHTSEVRAPVPSAASFNPYPAPVSRSHTRVGDSASAAALPHKSSKASAAAVADAASAAHHAYERPFTASSGGDSLRPLDIAAVEERMKLMRQSYLDQVRAIAGAQAKAFTLTAPDSMSARRMSRLATPGGQLRSMKGSYIALKPVIESANIVRQAALQRAASTPKSSRSRPSSAPGSSSRLPPPTSDGGTAAVRSQHLSVLERMSSEAAGIAQRARSFGDSA